MPTARSSRSSPMPPVPKSVKVGDVVVPLHMPFYYASLSNFWVYFQVDPAVLAPYFRKNPVLQGFAPFRFGGRDAVVNIDFQNYTGHGGVILETVNEIEFNLLAYPTARASDVPQGMKLADYLDGQDETKTIGNLRLHVPADNAFAVGCGIALFGEPKFLASFSYAVPALNDAPQKTWTITCFDSAKAPAAEQKRQWRKHEILTLSADLRGLTPATSNAGPFVEYGVLNGRPIGSNWSMFGTIQTWHPLEGAARRVKVSAGGSRHPMRKDVARILGRGAKPVAVQLFASPPVAAEPRAYYVDLA